MALTRAVAIVSSVLAAAVPVGCKESTSPPPMDVLARPLTAGYAHTCVLTGSGAAYCWGDNFYGQLGNGSTTNSGTPVAVAGGLRFNALAAGLYHTCGLMTSGAAYCWGRNAEGQLGDGSTTNSSRPVAVVGSLRFNALAAGGYHAGFGFRFEHTCGLTSSGAAYCWGENSDGQLGNGSYANSSRPIAVAGGLTFDALATGGAHTCGLTSSGVAYCWGFNSAGQLGNGSTTGSSTPVGVPGGLTFSALTTGEEHTCGLTSSGAAYCWGENYPFGKLGDGSFTSSSTPVPVGGGLSFSALALATGGDHTCGLTSSGTAYCWGRDVEGQLGNAATTNSATPVAVAGGLSFSALATGGLHTCGLTSSGAAYCWGYNGDGELGDGSTTDSSVPVRVAGQP